MLRPPNGSEQRPTSNQYPPENRTSGSAKPTIGTRIAKTTATKVGIFSGKEKNRLELSNLDTTHRFAIAILKDKKTLDGQDKTWVYVNTNTPDGPVRADVSSIANRLGLGGKAEVIRLSKEGKLEEKIKEAIDNYNKDVRAVQGVLEKIGKPRAEGSNKDLFGKVDFLNELKGLAQSEIKDEKLRNSLLKLVEIYSSHPMLPNDTKIDLDIFKSGFILQLSEIDKNFSPDAVAPREKVTKTTTLWESGSPNLLAKCVAKDLGIYPDYKKYMENGGAVRLEISLDSDKDNQYAIKTDGYVYHEKPEMSEKYLPYSKDGKTWVRLNINSLHDRTGIPNNKLQSEAKKSGHDGLKNLVEDRMSVLSKRSKTAPLQDKFVEAGFQQGGDISDILSNLTSYLSPGQIENLNKAFPEAGKEIDTTQAKVAQAQKYGFEGNDIDGANQFMEKYTLEIIDELYQFRRELTVIDGSEAYIPADSDFFGKAININAQRYAKNHLEPDNSKLPEVLASLDDELNKLSDDQLLKLFSLGIPWRLLPGYNAPTTYGKLMERCILERGNEGVRLAARESQTHILNYLLDNGAKTDTFLDGKSPLHIAVSNQAFTAAKILFENGADINARDAQGNTPLHLAAMDGHFKLLIEILDKASERLDLNIKNDKGETVKDIVLKSNVIIPVNLIKALGIVDL